MSSRLIAFIVAQVVVSLVAARVDHLGAPLYGYVFLGVASAQFALLGILFGIGDLPKGRRYTMTSLGVVGLCAFASQHTPFNGWELLLALIRFPVLGAIFSSVRRNGKLVLSRTRACADVKLLQLTLKQLLVFTSVTAGFLALDRTLDSYGGPFYEILLLVFVIMLGVGGALASVIASAVTLSRRDVSGALVSAIVIIVLAAAMAWLSYSSTDSWIMASRGFALPVIEALVAGTSVVALRMFGYGLSDASSGCHTPHA